jgi:hypothetical protein
MTRSLEGRLLKLEAVANIGREIIVWCDDEEQFEATVAEMIERGEISAADCVHCVHWLRVGPQSGQHERTLEDLD